jgi:hypothetical protein
MEERKQRNLKTDDLENDEFFSNKMKEWKKVKKLLLLETLGSYMKCYMIPCGRVMLNLKIGWSKSITKV